MDRFNPQELNQAMLDALSQLGQALFVVEDERVIFANQASSSLTGYTEQELKAMPSIFDIAGPGQATELAGRQLPEQTYTTSFYHKDGHLVDLEFSVKLLEKLPRRVLVIARDISHRRQAEQHIKHQDLHDSLTDLPNRKALDDLFINMHNQAKLKSAMVGVMFIDLDRFKNINSTLGHYVGDAILKQVAERFQTALRGIDIVARLGGDEFLILLPNLTSAKSAVNAAEKLLHALHEPLLVEDYTLHVSTSIGIALCPQDGEDLYTLLKHADTALYRAKAGGRNRYQFYDYAMNMQSQAKLSLENDLRLAIQNNELVMHYQPIVNGSGKVVGIESLLRWQHPKLGLLYPDSIIPMAEETGLIVPIGEWSIETACKQITQWRKHGLTDCRMAVNFSGRQFSEYKMLRRLKKIFQENSLDPGCLEMEITETIAMDSAERTFSKFKELGDLGIAISIDDFGTGYSSLSYLKRFPAARLKIDKSFVEYCTTDPQDTSIIRAIIAMAKSLGVETVAEGVETDEQFEFLLREGCDAFQGFLFSKPLPAEELTEWLKEHK